MKLLPFDYAVRNLSRSPTRLGLCVLGSALVVVLILAAAAFVRGMQASLNVSGSQHNVIILGAGSEESVERSEIEASVPSILQASVPGILTRSDVAYISPQVHVMLPVRTQSQMSSDKQIIVRGITPTALLVHEHVRITHGRLPQPGADEIMLGRMAAAAIGVREADLAIGKALIIDGKPWEIVGRFASPGTVLEGEAWTALADIMTSTKRTTISCAIVTLDPQEAEFADIAVFTKMRPDLELVALAEREYYSSLSSFFRPIQIVAWITAGLIAMGGLFGGLNTMYAAFVSRVRELGTLQSIGFRRIAIVINLMQESLLATAAGTLIACALAISLLDGLAVRFSMGTFGLVVDPSVIFIGIVAGTGLGILGALPPAIRCLRMTIPVALKAV